MPETGLIQTTDGCDHQVRLYDDAAPVLAELADEFVRVLAADDSVVIFATPEHRADLALHLARRGCDLDHLVVAGRYQAFDAWDVLQQIMPDGGRIDPARFADIAGAAIRRGRAAATSMQPRVAVFGELVALLCLDGAHDAAIALERLWSELLATEPCTLRCAYPLAAFPQRDDLAALDAICALHSHVTPANTYGDLSESARALALVRVQHLARASETASIQRAEAQALAQQREAELADFLEEVPVALHRVDADGIIRWANRAELELTGYARDEYVGRHIADVHADSATIADILARLARGEALQDYPARLRRKDGSLRHVVISSNARWTNGAFNHTRCVTRDVTDQLRAHEAMTRLAAIVDSTDDAVIGKTLDGMITSWNLAAERLYGYSAAEAIGQPITLIVPPERRDELADIMARLRRGERIAHHETERVRRDGRRVEVSLSISPIRDATGTIIGASKIARDITERRAAEQRRQAFLEMLAHDLRSPLTAVRGYAQLMQRRQAFNQRATEAIIAEASRMGRLVADVLEMARLDAARLELRRAEVDLVALARRCAEQSSLLAHHEREVRVDAPDESIIGAWDADRLAQVVTNLIDNALKYAPDGPIVVRLERQPNQACLAVSDQGPGIAPAEQERIFERFGRAAEATASGMGLGLYISRALVDAHGGRLWVDSLPGHGSTFSLALPYALPGDAADAPSLDAKVDRQT